MGRRVNRLNNFGLEVTMFCASNGISKQYLAALAGVDYTSIWKVGSDQRAGVTVIPRVRAAMADYIRERKEG